MQISPNAEWTLRTDPHGTHSLYSETRIGSSTMMQVPKRKTSTTNEAHPHSVCVHWCVFSFKKFDHSSVAQLVELSHHDLKKKKKKS